MKTRMLRINRSYRGKNEPMDFTKVITLLPINNFHKFSDPDDWFGIYYHHYPTDQEQEEIYRLEDWISSYR
jgi:hypothetical protein